MGYSWVIYTNSMTESWNIDAQLSPAMACSIDRSRARAYALKTSAANMQGFWLYRTLLLADKYCSTEEMHSALNLQFLCERREFHFINLCHKNVFTKGEQTGLSSFFNFRSNENRRVSRRANEFDLVVPDIRSNVGRKSVGYRGPYSWNRLCNELKGKDKFIEFVSLWKRICFSNFENHPT